MPSTGSDLLKVNDTCQSNRWWKTKQDKKHSTIKKVKTLKSSWDKKMEVKAKKEMVKRIQDDIRDRKVQERQEKKERKEEQEKRRLENERKSEIVQKITKIHKLKKTKKRQLRSIQMRDTTQVSK
uniref:Coiled-coil domain-containing protein 86 n=1 Tax=Caenorhabditis tropicalis TaxID=1561998 RepID=A0A1I7TCG5_9PELO